MTKKMCLELGECVVDDATCAEGTLELEVLEGG
jgi:hypothetical protein